MDMESLSEYHATMTHDSAVRTVINLAPEIEKRGAANVLTEFARKEDLPPAQLEKLGQVYNTLKTVSHIDSATDHERGTTVPLLDVTTMVIGYATGADREKAAARPESFSTHDPRFVDLNVALRRELNGGAMQKAAAEHDLTAAPGEVEEKFAAQVKSAALDAAILELEVDLDDEMAKLAGAIIGAAPIVSDNVFVRDIYDFEHDALRRQPAALVKLAGEYLEKYAAPLHIKLVRFDHKQPIEKYAYEVPHTQGEQFAELATAAGTHDFIMKLANASVEERREMLNSPDAGLASMFGDIPAQEEPPAAADEADPDALSGAAVEKGLTNASDQKPSENSDKRQKREKEESDDKGGGSGSSSGSKAQGGKPGESFGSRVGNAVAAPIAAISSGIQGAARSADDLLTKVTSKERMNKPQRNLDVDIADIKRAMLLNRMIANDPVLREADPREVLEIYNSVVNKYPDIGGDMASLKLVLREAVSYEGLTLDSQKMLSEIRKNQAQGEKEDGENEKRRYTAGGASPLQIATK